MSNYNPYPAYKDSGVEWLGRVPEHWTIGPYKATIQIENGSDYKEVEADDGYPVIGSGGPFAFSSSRMYEGESVLLGRKGTIDKPLYVNGAFWAVDTMYWSIIKPGAHGRFAYYIATTIPFDMYSTNTALPSMTKSVLGSHIVAFPRFEEQQAIATRLDRETARIDALVEKKVRFIELLREKILSSVGKAFECEESRWIRLQHICDVMSRPTEQEEEKSYVRLGLYNRGRGIFKKEEADAEDMGDSDFFWVECGDLILSGQFAWEGSVALAGAEHDACVVSHRYPIIRGRSGEVLTEYLLAFFLSHYGDFLLNDCSRGSAGRNRPLNLGSLLKWKIPVPPMEQQEKVASLVRYRRELLRKVEISITLLKERRSALITAAVTGQIDLRETV
ncbi:restriction endonuclease subunit S [Pseudomonas saxonica]|uniref:Restriction endonuclease n=1 Tax=Pseudomonas saxonica TaxID=2600598 RepID=A0A5C5PYC2_9PSED|nr:restriction endonuclease subunit S [Pseudomonas saxonica]TWR95472.1 restriction endonuclease [Pseudomonas saxonica]